MFGYKAKLQIAVPIAYLVLPKITYIYRGCRQQSHLNRYKQHRKIQRVVPFEVHCPRQVQFVTLPG